MKIRALIQPEKMSYLADKKKTKFDISMKRESFS